MKSKVIDLLEICCLMSFCTGVLVGIVNSVGSIPIFLIAIYFRLTIMEYKS